LNKSKIGKGCLFGVWVNRGFYEAELLGKEHSQPGAWIKSERIGFSFHFWRGIFDIKESVTKL
jgi:hypothetical protein